MRNGMTFDQIVGLADGLSLPQKESLLEFISKRLMEQRRRSLGKDIREANREFRAVRCRAVAPAELMQEITG